MGHPAEVFYLPERKKDRETKSSKVVCLCVTGVLAVVGHMRRESCQIRGNEKESKGIPKENKTSNPVDVQNIFQRLGGPICIPMPFFDVEKTKGDGW